MTYLTTSSEVSEPEDPYGFTFAPTALTFSAANFRLMDNFNWKRAAIVYDLQDTGGLYVKVRPKIHYTAIVNNPFYCQLNTFKILMGEFIN